MNRQQYKYYSQNGEDFLLWEVFERKSAGFFVDVGAFDGVHLSNTYSFEQQGWQGICVEPHPKYYEYCKQARLNSTCLNLACVADDTIEKIEFFAEELGLLSGIYAREEDVRDRYKRRKIEFSGFNKVSVPAMTLTSLLEKQVAPQIQIDFISIDVEGAEMDVLRGLDLSRFRPRVLIIEASSAGAKKMLDTHLAAGNGYAFARTLGENNFYARDPDDIEKLRQTVVKCEIESNLHPLGEKYTIKPFVQGKIIKPENLIQKAKRSIRLLVRSILK